MGCKPPEQTVPSAFAHNRAFLVKTFSKDLNRTLSSFGIEGLNADERIRTADSRIYEGCLNIGMSGFDENVVALAISSIGCCFQGMPIKVLLIPPMPEGALLVDEKGGKVATRLFFEFKEGSIVPIETDKPVALQGLNILYEGREGYAGPENILMNDSDLSALTSDKMSTKRVLESNGIPTPKWLEIEGTDAESIAASISSFVEKGCEKGFVIKGNEGSGGIKVRLFERAEIDHAKKYAARLRSSGDRVFIEERVESLELRDAEGTLLDWNVRALVTFGRSPAWIDAEVRYAPKNGVPVNVHNGAKVEELEDICRITHVSIDEIKRMSIEVSKALFGQAGKADDKTTGFVGLDLMIGEDGIAVIEANSGAVGGFASLAKLRKAPLDSVRTLLEEIGPFLAGNKDEKQMAGPFAYMANTYTQDFHLGIEFFRNKQYIDAIDLLKRAVEIQNSPHAHRMIGESFIALGRYDEAIGYYKERAERCESGILSEKAVYVNFLLLTGRVKEAKAFIEEKSRGSGDLQTEVLDTIQSFWLKILDRECKTAAQGYLDHILEIFPQNPLVFYIMGGQAQFDNDMAGMQIYLEKALEHGITGPGALECLLGLGDYHSSVKHDNGTARRYYLELISRFQNDHENKFDSFARDSYGLAINRLKAL